MMLYDISMPRPLLRLHLLEGIPKTLDLVGRFSRADAVYKHRPFTMSHLLLSECGVFFLVSDVEILHDDFLAIQGFYLSIIIFAARIVCR
jgi:hypothetical protein